MTIVVIKLIFYLIFKITQINLKSLHDQEIISS